MSGNWIKHPMPLTNHKTFDLYYLDDKYRGQVESFDGETFYANIHNRRSGAMSSEAAARQWVEKNVLRVIPNPAGGN